MKSGRSLVSFNLIVMAAALFVFALPAALRDAFAQANDPLSITLTLNRVLVDAQGKEVLKDAAKVKPGELVEYRAVYANGGNQPLGNVLATLPIPKEMEYMGQSAWPTPVQASIDGKEFAAEPLKRTVKDKDGKPVTVIVPYAEYRLLRWEIKSLAPGKEFVVKARARVSPLPPQPSAVPEAGAVKRRGGGS
jgi:uncharacterized repeat protein (TIGR01451 family)